MQADKISEQRLIEKIRHLVPEQMVLVENFIDSLSKQNTDVSLTLAAAKLSEPALHKIWDNPDDAEYDQL
ncbi:toxin-antitoxin system, antitoxin component, Xre family protein [Tolypothrix sp. VBCCA 56010]|uniref:toxin-antitoxin system, antitoxin component, Xre family protein n=1 Tax=Tolypothrix sp. VBCCA 56010 TaxID=3137731 RepID=UPI003D7EE585